MDKKGLSIAIAQCVLCILFVGCRNSDNPTEQRVIDATKNKKTLRIAAAAPWAQKRNMLWEGLTLARDEINGEGGVLGRQIELVPFDDDNDAGQGQQAAYEIAAAKDIVAVIGHSASAVSVPNALLYHYYGILMLSPLSTSTSLTTQGFDKVFRNIPSDDVFGMEAARFCGRMGWQKVLAYYIDNTYGSSQANVFEQECANLGMTVVDRSSYDATSSGRDYAETAAFWTRNYEFDAIYIAGTMPQAGEIVSEFRRKGIDAPIVGGDAFDHPLLLSTAGSAANNVYAVTIYDNESTYPPFVKFRDRFRDKYGKDIDQAALQGYDALEVLVEGIRKAGSIAPDRIADGLRSIETWEGPAGPYAFDASGNVVGKNVVVKRVRNGEFEKVK